MLESTAIEKTRKIQIDLLRRIDRKLEEVERLNARELALLLTAMLAFEDRLLERQPGGRPIIETEI